MLSANDELAPQAYHYFLNYPKDNILTKALVCTASEIVPLFTVVVSRSGFSCESVCY